MRTVGIRRLCAVVVVVVGTATSVLAQDSEPATREAAIEQAQAERVSTLHPYVPGKTEALFARAEDILVNGVPSWHPYFESADYGGGFTLGVGYAHHVSPYNMLDVRGSYTVLGYKRLEGEFTAPRLFHRRGALSLLGGWREATQGAFYGLGMGTSLGNRADFDFQQPYASATFALWPTRRLLMLRGGVELSQWSQRAAERSTFPHRTVYTPATLPGLKPPSPIWFAGHRRIRLANVSRVFATRRFLRRHAAQLRRTRTSASGPGARLRRSSMRPSCAKPGSLAPRHRADHLQHERPAGALLHALHAGSGRRCAGSATASATRTV